MPTARWLNRKWKGVVDEAIDSLEAAAMKCDRLREANRGAGLAALKNRQAAADITITVQRTALKLLSIKWEPARGSDDNR